MNARIFNTVDSAGLAFFRVILGVLGFADVTASFVYYHHMVGAFDPSNFQFYYYGFAWVTVFPEPFMSLFFLFLMGLGLAVAAGWRYRITAPLFALGFTYYFLLEKAHYLNHAYLYCWLAWVMAILPAWREWSIDVWQRPHLRRQSIPLWTHALPALLMGVVYFFGGIAKLNADWIGAAMPLKLWLDAKSELWLIGPVIAQEWVAWFMSWGGALFDLSIVFLLLGKRTRILGLAMAIFFHLTNHLIFNIGIFPYLSLALTGLFFPPHWPRKWFDHLVSKYGGRFDRWQQRWRNRLATRPAQKRSIWQINQFYQLPICIGLALLLFVQGALPLRHHLFPGDVAWSEEGHRYAWRMMLRTKYGRGYFTVKDLSTGESERVSPRQELRLKQSRKLFTHPDMILQYAHHLRDQAAEEGREVAVYAHIRTSLNGRDSHLYVDENVDLAKEEWSFWKSSAWINWPNEEE